MAKIKINQRNYDVPELTFKHLPMMEKSGLSVFQLASGDFLFTTAQVFTSIVVDCSLDDADYLLEQHILGGGEFTPLFTAFRDALESSAFFTKLLESMEKPAEQNRK